MGHLTEIKGSLDAPTFGDLNESVRNRLAQVMAIHSPARALRLYDR
jgi:hypothetical protein